MRVNKLKSALEKVSSAIPIGNIFENKTSPMKSLIAMMQNNPMFSPLKMKEHLNNQNNVSVANYIIKEPESKEDKNCFSLD